MNFTKSLLKHIDKLFGSLRSDEQIQEILKSENNIALMCSELDFKTCHRWNLVGVDLAKKGLIMNHINKAGNIENYSQLL